MAKSTTASGVKVNITATKKNERVYFTGRHDALELPNLVDHQTKAFQWFVEEGLGELLAEISPIDDYTGS